MTIDRKKFFDGIRSGPFTGKLNKGQVEGITAILDEWERRKLDDPRWLAYMLATVKHETSHTMQPIKEMGGLQYLKAKKYYPWYGRGYVQLTWDYNYKAYQGEVLKIFDVDIVKDPDKALLPSVAAYVMFDGMLKGRFNKHKKGLGHYFNEKQSEWIEARRTVNVLDDAAEIAGVAKQFYADLVAASA